MGILKDISQIVSKLEKRASFYGYATNPVGIASNTTTSREYLDQRDAIHANLLRGLVRGAGKEAIPGVVDFIGGGTIGVANGLSELFHGPSGSFREGFSRGMADFQNTVTNPMRRDLGRFGRKIGVAGALDKLVEQSESRAGGPTNQGAYADMTGEIVGDLAASWPMYAKAIPAMMKIPKWGGNALAKATGMANNPGVTKPITWAYGYQTMGGPEAVDALKSGWQWFTGRGYDANPQLAEYRDQNINQVKDLARWYIDNGYQQEFEDLMSSEGGSLLSGKDKEDLFGSADERFNGGRSQ